MIKIIAEAATCHAGDVELGKKLILMAASAGADTIKFQHIVPHQLYVPHSKSNGERVPNPAIQNRMAEKLSDHDLHVLKQFADEVGIEFALTLFDIESLELVSILDLHFVKIASGDLNYLSFLEKIRALEVPVLLSTGMASMSEISAAIKVLAPKKACELTLLHCVSVYPCPSNLINLSRISELKEFGYEVGFSDHSLGEWAASAAVALGSSVIEKHIRLENGPKTADYDHSMTEAEFTKFVKSIRNIESGMLKNSAGLSDDEILVKQRARRGIYANKDLPAGHIVSQSDLAFLRPENDFSPMMSSKVVGKKVLNVIKKGDPIGHSDIQ